MTDDIYNLSPPWVSRRQMPHDLALKAFETCQRGKPGRCVIANWSRASAKALGRRVRQLRVYGGNIHWSENNGEVWFMASAPLTEDGAVKADGFDHDGQHFRAPKSPFGPGVFKGVCVKRTFSSPEVKQAADVRFRQRVKDGVIRPGSKFRERQLPLVRAMAEAI